jgi:hypothetical protein
MTHLLLSALGWWRRATKPLWSLYSIRGQLMQLVYQHLVLKMG